jgi:hypothetical protein
LMLMPSCWHLAHCFPPSKKDYPFNTCCSSSNGWLKGRSLYVYVAPQFLMNVGYTSSLATEQECMLWESLNNALIIHHWVMTSPLPIRK